MIRKSSTRRLGRRRRQGLEGPALVVLPGGREEGLEEASGGDAPAARYVRRPRDGGYAARWAVVLATANGEVWARERDQRPAPRRPLLRRRARMLRP